MSELDIRSLALDVRDLAELAPRADTALTQRVAGGGFNPPVPINVAADSLASDIAWTLSVWEPPVREAARLGPERTRPARRQWIADTAVAIIAPRVELLAALPLTCGYADGLDAGPVERTGLEAIDQLRSLHRRARSMLGLTRLTHRLPGDCSTCGATMLTRENGSETVRCGLCADALSYDDYRRMVALTVGAAMEGRP